jgi:hypothetical protein
MKTMKASPETLMRQAPATVDLYLEAAVKTLDGMFGEGYAKANPVLVAAYIRSCVEDFKAGLLSIEGLSIGLAMADPLGDPIAVRVEHETEK